MFDEGKERNKLKQKNGIQSKSCFHVEMHVLEKIVSKIVAGFGAGGPYSVTKGIPACTFTQKV